MPVFCQKIITWPSFLTMSFFFFFFKKAFIKNLWLCCLWHEFTHSIKLTLSLVELCCCTFLCFVFVSHLNWTQVFQNSGWNEIDEALPTEPSHTKQYCSPCLQYYPKPQILSRLKRPRVGELEKDKVVLWKITVPRLCDFSRLVFFSICHKSAWNLQEKKKQTGTLYAVMVLYM